MRVLGIVGIWDFPRPYMYMWHRLEAAFSQELPGSTIEPEHPWYSPWETQKMLDFADHLVEKNDTGGDLLMIGYSLGGVIATAIAPRFTKTQVRCVTTIFAPHQYMSFSAKLGSDPTKMKHIPVLSFGGWLDPVVPCGTEFPGARKHVMLWSDHLATLLLSDKPAQRFAKETALVLKTPS